MPWLSSDLMFKFLPEGREHDRCLNIIHNFTKKVIDDRAQAYENSQIYGKRSVFLGKFFDLICYKNEIVTFFFHSDSLLKQKHHEQLTLLDIQEEVDTFMFEVENKRKKNFFRLMIFF